MLKATAAVLIFLLAAFSAVHSSSAEAAEKDGTVQDYLNKEEKAEKKENSQTPNPIPQDASKPGVTAWDFIKMIAATIFVVGLIYVLFRFISSKNKMMTHAAYLQTLGGTSLGQNRSIQLVKAGDDILLVGVGDSIQLLKVIEDEEEIERIVKQYEDKGVDLQGARALFSKAAQSFGGKAEAKPALSFKQSLQKQLEELGKERKQKEEDWIRKGNSEK
ncbi:flagellar biosynthetic protein FliO [Bacillus sp. FJAT-42376]|uniref:flagellar biosynthetic protein FliO n=1 Tax=Bacillus sp. FJAT-42376 TaxID=2014076 RepID=UPI001F152846|nr:flagellar biosynthetic protein FliO [Bacillus sp. FJAT-42376]